MSSQDEDPLAKGATNSGPKQDPSAAERNKLRKQSLMKSLESLEASPDGSPLLAPLAEKNEEGEDDVIGDLPFRRAMSPQVEDLGNQLTREAASHDLLSTSMPLDFLQRQASPEDRSSEPFGSRSSSKESESHFSVSSRPTDRGRSKELLKKGSTAAGSGTTVRRLDREELERLGQEIKDIRSTYEDKFVEKMDYLSLLSRMARVEESLEEQLGQGGTVTSMLGNLTKESRMHMADSHKLRRELEEISKATVENTSRIRDESHRVENAASHAFRTAKHLEQVSKDFSVTKEAMLHPVLTEVFREDVSRMAKAVQVLANEFSMFEQENLESDQQKAEQIRSASDAIKELQEQIGRHEIKGSTMEGGLEHIKQEVDLCAKQVGLKKLERTIMDMQEESARLREVVHEKFFQIQDQERREVMAAFAARWDPYNKTRLLRKTVDGWVEFLRRQNKSREALARVKQVYAKTHVTARLRSWWYLMQRDHTDGQFKRLSENLETQEAKLEGARGALLRHEKATSEQARNLQYRVLAVEKGLEAAEREKATKQEVTESLGEIDRRLTEELSLNPIREDIVHIKDLIQKLQDDKMDAVDAEADRDKVHGFCSEFRTWLQRHDESIKRKAEISENDTKADARTIEQVLVLLAKQADQLATVVAHDFDQLRKALTRFLEISPDFRKASLAIGFEPHEQCVACRALPRKCANDGATGSDGVVYKLSMDTSISTIEETQKMLAEKLRYPLSLASNAFAGCARPLNNRAEDTDTVSDQQLPLLRQIVLAESGWLAGKESLPDRIAFSRKLVHTEAPSLQDVPIPVATPRSKRRPPSAQDAGRDRPQSVRSYFPAVGGPGGSAQKAR
ncbi:unnamed protein product [Durusdinium trenchii]|uniref:Uncharacterized protein n=1 Tax=Durusdinium trenchii TaxID=1381693 RepID=A0ABP0PG62_9DINO